MISFFSRHRRIIFIGTVTMFLGGIFVGLGAYVFTSGSVDAVADVGGKKISYQRFLLQVNRALSSFRDSGAEVSEVVSKSVKQEVFREMIIEELLSRQAAEMGMRVPDFEVAVEIQNTPQFMDGKVFSPRAYYTVIYNEFHMSPAEYEAWRKQARLASKFKQFVYSNIKTTPEELTAYYLAKNKDLKNFEKEKDKYLDELSRDKFAQIANYLLKQLTMRLEIKDYLKQREQGQ
ncbi:MAG: SurA N-terminal domain-containing protein [Elusimicrobia bacterium]|nr:SurA N-terminal domain-containing protein [Elusimicrobiota bacterium]